MTDSLINFLENHINNANDWKSSVRNQEENVKEKYIEYRKEEKLEEYTKYKHAVMETILYLRYIYHSFHN